MGGEIVLVVDDNAMNLKLVRFLLERRGYDVREAKCGADALSLLEQVVPAIILMDIQLPGIDGLELTRRIKRDARTRDVPVIAVTAFAMTGDDKKAADAGCDGYVTKPIDTQALPGIVERFIKGRVNERAKP
jgi:two-component system, cell cycle response regulator DivK